MNIIDHVYPSASQTSSIPNGIRLTYTQVKDTYFGIALKEKLVEGKKYLLTYYVSGLSSTATLSFGFFRSGVGNVSNKRIYNGFNEHIIDGFDASSLTMDDSGGAIAGDIIDIINFKLEPLTETNYALTKTGILSNAVINETIDKKAQVYKYGNIVCENFYEY